MANFIVGVISLTLGVVVLAGVFITTVKGTDMNSTCINSTGGIDNCAWSSGEIALWGLLTITSVAGMVYGVLNVFGLT